MNKRLVLIISALLLVSLLSSAQAAQRVDPVEQAFVGSTQVLIDKYEAQGRQVSAMASELLWWRANADWAKWKSTVKKVKSK